MNAPTTKRVVALLGAALILAVASGNHAGELRFQHLMNIGTRGNGPGQFNYIEDLAFSKDGRLLVTDAANSTTMRSASTCIRRIQ
jgi:hypothetical protein